MKIRFPKTSLLLKAVVVRMALGFLAGLCFLFALSASWLWACEVWMRPDIMLYWDERWIAAAAVAGFGAGFVLLLKPARAARTRRAMVMVALCGLAFMGVCFAAHVFAIQGLMRHRDMDRILQGEVLLPDSQLVNLHAQNVDQKEFTERWLKDFLSRRHYQYESLDHLIEVSRWRVRKAFLKKIITAEKHVGLVTMNWPRLFPAVIGQDVTLARRQELMRWLDALAQDKSAEPRIRDAALFWMGLIVLTDSVEFAADRAHVRDMILASDDPPMSLTGDVWMRVLNSLLASDDSEKIANCSSRLACNRILLRRSVREGVRGMENQTDAVIHEIETLDAAGESHAAAALWLDLRLLIERTGGNSAHGEPRRWLCETLVKWLTEDSESVRGRFADGANRAKFTDFVIEMPEQMRAKLAAHAMRVLEHVPPQPEFGQRWHSSYVAPLVVEHALMIRNFLDADNRKMVSGRLASIMLDHMRFVKNHRETIGWPVHAMEELAWIFKIVSEDIDDKHHEQIGKILDDEWKTEILHKILDFRPLDQLFRIIDEIPSSARISGAERLAFLAMSGGRKGYSGFYWWGNLNGQKTHAFTSEEVNEFLDAFLNAARSGEKLFQVSRRTDGLWFHANRLARAMRVETFLTRKDDDVRVRDLIRLSLIRMRLLGYEHLPVNWPDLFRAERSIHGRNWDFPDERYWAPLVDTPMGAQAMLDRFDVPNDYVLQGLMEYLEKNPPKPEVKEAILKYFESRLYSDVRSQRITANRVLLKLSHWLAPDRQVEFRRELHDFFNEVRPSLNEWAHTMMLPMTPLHDYPRQYAIQPEQCRSEWIEWKDDELSAHFSWSSQIHHELSMLPHDWRIFPNRELLMYLNTYLDACDACPWTGLVCEPAGLDVALSGRYRRGLPPDAPFEATPWQRARELHLRKPELDFPDRALFRPNMRQR